MKIGGCIRNFFKNLHFKKITAIKNEMKILKNAFYANFFITNCIFYDKFECRMFPAFIWCTYCPCKSKIMNFQKSLYRKWANFRGQSRLLRSHLTTKLCNLGLCSKALEEDKDVSFHLRSYLVDLWWKTRTK